MKRVDDKTVIDTVAECLQRNSMLNAADQKEPKAIASDLVMAFQELDAKLNMTRRQTSPSKRRSP